MNSNYIKAVKGYFFWGGGGGGQMPLHLQGGEEFYNPTR